MKTTKKADRPENYERLKPIIDRIVKLPEAQDLVCVVAFVASVLGEIKGVNELCEIVNLCHEELSRFVPAEEEKRIIHVV